MHSIENFAAGLIPNAAWSGLRNIAAQNWKDLRVNPQGFAIQRDGHRTVYAGGSHAVDQIFAYKNLLFAVIDGKLRWARARERGEEVTFNDFDPILEIDTEHHYHFQPIETAGEDYILFSNGTGDPEHRRGGPYYIDLTDVFERNEPPAPTVHRCYLPNPNNPYGLQFDEVNNDKKNSDAEYEPFTTIDLYFQAVRTIGEQETVPWVFDFTEQPSSLPELAPTLAVSEAISAVDIGSNATFTAAIEGAGHRDAGDFNELRVGVTGITGGGDSPTASLVVNTGTTPDTIQTQGNVATWVIEPGSFRVQLTGYNLLLDWRSEVKLQVSVGNTGWRTIGEEEDWLNQNFGTEDRISVNYDAFTIGRLPTNAVIAFRITSTNGDIELLDSPTIRIQALSGFSVATLADAESLSDVSGEDLRTQYDKQPRTEISFNLNLGAANEDADYVDVYISRRRRLPNPARQGVQLIARLPHQDQYRFTIKIPINDLLMPNNWVDLPEQGELATWSYADVDEHRMYAAARDSNRLYLSDFDGIARRHFMNFTNFINLPTNGEEITGIKFLYDNFLVVYTPHKIISIRTDPVLSRTRIASRYSPGAEDEAVGCIAPRSLVEIGDYHCFLSPNKRAYRFGGRKPSWMSASVQPLLEPLALPEAPDASFELSNAVAVAHKGSYHLSFPSLTEEPVHYLYWKGQKLTWKGDNLEWKEDYFEPNNILIYDFDRDKWYKDGFGVSSYAKDPRDRLYGIVHGNILALYDDAESDEEFDWLWQSNQILLSPRTTIFNVCVKTQIAVDMEVTVKTENGEETRQLESQHADDYWGQYAGFDLIGRTVEITVKGRGRTIIDRININEQV